MWAWNSAIRAALVFVLFLGVILIIVVAFTGNSGSSEVSTPTPEPTDTPAARIYQPVQIVPIQRVNAQGTVHTEPFSVTLEDGTIKPLWSQMDFTVLRTIPDGSGKPGSYSAIEGLSKTYDLNDIQLQEMLEADYRQDCTKHGNCQWVEYTIEHGKLSSPTVVGQRPELLRTPTPTPNALRTP